MTSVRVRPAAAEDRAFISELGKTTLPASLSTLRPAPSALVESAYDHLLATVFEQSHVALIAEDAATHERLGFLLMLDRLPDEVTLLPQGFIAYMAVTPGAQRNGIGKSLLTAAEDEARKRGLPHVALMVTEENAAAQALYQEAGYTTERRLLCKPLEYGARKRVP